MCGILGSVNKPLELKKVKSSMMHRGPDAQTHERMENVDLVHFRLSIVDLEGGAQPMHLADRYAVIFNGEIYNHSELREKYALECKTSSDTETLLHLYHKLGAECLKEIDGMYAFVIYDRSERKLFIARDKAGKKPLYYLKKGTEFVFASELNAIKSIAGQLDINEEALKKYTLYGSMVGKQTPYADVQEFPAASYGFLNTENNDLQVTTWWSILDQYKKPSSDSYDEAKSKVDFFLKRHIQRRIISSDLEVGSFLSGGIDSGLVTSIASEYTDNLKTFTVIFDGPYNEGPLAKQVSDKYRTEHTEINIDFSDLNQNIEAIIGGYGEPFFDSSAIPSWYVSREARKHVTVILNGDGADELFGGYRRYVPFAKFDFFNSGALLRGLASTAGSILPAPKNRKNKYNFIHRLAKLASKKDIELYLSAGVDIFSDYENLLNFSTKDVINEDQAYYAKVIDANLTGLQKLLTIDFDINLFNDLLVKMDIATMAHSLEGRSPFMGTDLLDYVPTIKDEYKVNGTTTKRILRDLAVDYLPPDLIHQPKRGFEIPLKNWTKTLLKDIMHDYLLSDNAYSSDFISKSNKEKMLAYKAGIPEEKNAKMLYTLFAMDVWAKKNI